MKNAECKNKIALAAACGKSSYRAEVVRRQIVIFLAIAVLLLPTLTFGESGNRWLMVFDTSSAMESRSKGTQDVVQDLLLSGMHGQLHPGDTIGIWTFSDKLHAGEAPLQVWSPDVSQMIARHTMQYLETLHYSKSANLTAVLTNVYALVDSSKFITIILFSDGDQSMKGTPFDDEINKQYKDNYKKQKKAGLPVITVLEAQRGSFTTNTVNFGPWPIEIPTVPVPPAPKRPVEPQAAPKPETAPPIIFDGRKSQSATPDNTTLPANNVAELAPPTVTQPTVAATPAETPSAVQPETTQPAPPTVVAQSPPPAATPPPTGVIADNQSESKPAAAPVLPPVANQSEPPPSSPAETQSKPAASLPVETATSAASPNLLSTRNLAIVSVAFAALVCGLLLLAARNARKTHASLITRSLEREQR
jgi:hypothetical protein